MYWLQTVSRVRNETRHREGCGYPNQPKLQSLLHHLSFYPGWFIVPYFILLSPTFAVAKSQSVRQTVMHHITRIRLVLPPLSRIPMQARVRCDRSRARSGLCSDATGTPIIP